MYCCPIPLTRFDIPEITDIFNHISKKIIEMAWFKCPFGLAKV